MDANIIINNQTQSEPLMSKGMRVLKNHSIGEHNPLNLAYGLPKLAHLNAF